MRHSRKLQSWLMLASVVLPIMASGSATAAVTESGADDFCYTGTSDADSDGTGVAPKDKVDTIPITIEDENATGKAAMKEIADAIGKKLNILPALVYAQMAQESGANGDSYLAKTDKNYSGIKGEGGSVPTDGTGGTYQHFDSLSDYASRYAAILKNDGLSGMQTPEEYVHQLKNMNYFTDSEEHYLAGVKALMAGYYGDTSDGTSAVAGSDESSSSSNGSWHKGDDDFPSDDLNTTFTNGFGSGGSKDDDSDSTDTSGAQGVSGDWTKEGTEAYKNAKTIFDYFTKKLGFSGAGAAGVVGNVAIESSFNLMATNGSHWGLFQWQASRLAANNMNGNDAGTMTMDNQMKLVTMELNNGYKQVKSEVGHATSAEQAAHDWQYHFEVAPGQADEQRKANAIKAYQLFNGSSIEANDSLLGAGDVANAGLADSTGDSKKTSSACSDQKADSGQWGWPFKSIPSTGPTGYEDGQQFGTTSFQRQGGAFHDGFDFGSARYSGDVLAIHDGTVYKVGESGDGRGIRVDVKSDDGYYEIYQEAFNSLSDVSVKEGDHVSVGDKIGTLTTNHLHLGISKTEIEKAQSSAFKDDGTWLDPIKVIKGENTDQH